MTILPVWWNKKQKIVFLGSEKQHNQKYLKNKDLNRTSIYFHYPHYAFHSLNKMGSAVRKGEYKLLYYHVTEEVELYDLKIDIGETTNLAEEKPEIAKELLADLKAWLVETDAEMPRRTADIKDDELVGKIN